MLIKKVVIFLFFISVNLYSNSLLKNLVSEEVEGVEILKGRILDGVPLVVYESEKISNKVFNRGVDLIEEFRDISLESIRIIPGDNEDLNITFLTDDFLWREKTLASFIPSGFTLIVEESVKYVTDLFISNTHYRVEGYYSGKDDFFNKLLNIVDKPGEFLIARDPEYIFRKFSELSQKIDRLNEENLSLKDKNIHIENELKELKFNNLVMENRGLFGTIKPLDRDLIEWIVDKKEKNSELTSQELKDLVLQEKDKKVDTQTVDLIFGLYFGEYKEG